MAFLGQHRRVSQPRAPATPQRPNHHPPSAQQKAEPACLAFRIARILAQQRCERGQNTAPLKHFKIGSDQRVSAPARTSSHNPPPQHFSKAFSHGVRTTGKRQRSPHFAATAIKKCRRAGFQNKQMMRETAIGSSGTEDLPADCSSTTTVT